MHHEILFGKTCPRLLLLISILFFARVVGAADQPQWGERFSRNMVSSERGLPESFYPATGKDIRWTAKIGSQSYATPIVANGTSSKTTMEATRGIIGHLRSCGCNQATTP